jgi:hypothetical protein
VSPAAPLRGEDLPAIAQHIRDLPKRFTHTVTIWRQGAYFLRRAVEAGAFRAVEFQPMHAIIEALLGNEHGAYFEEAYCWLAKSLGRKLTGNPHRDAPLGCEIVADALLREAQDLRHVEDDGTVRPAMWFARATKQCVNAELLERARRDGRLKGAEKRGGRWYYAVERVCELWENHRSMLEAALKADPKADGTRPKPTEPDI